MIDVSMKSTEISVLVVGRLKDLQLLDCFSQNMNIFVLLNLSYLPLPHIMLMDEIWHIQDFFYLTPLFACSMGVNYGGVKHWLHCSFV